VCKQGTTVPMPIYGRVRDIDSCIAHLVAALNAGGITTIASCCGHGNTPGNIALQDGRELVIAPNYEVAREIDKAFPDIHGNMSSNYELEKLKLQYGDVSIREGQGWGQGIISDSIGGKNLK